MRKDVLIAATTALLLVSGFLLGLSVSSSSREDVA